MLADIKKIIKHSAIYGLSRISTKLVGIILLPLYSSAFSVDEYGVIVRIETLWQVLWAIFLFGLESGVVRWYTTIEDTARKKRFLFNISFFLFSINLVFILILYLSSNFFSEVIFKSFKYSNLVFYASLIASLEAFIFLIFLLIRIQERAVMYTIFSVLGTLINLGLQIYFISYTSIKLDGIFLSKIISPLVIIIFLLPYYIKFVKFGIEFNIMKELIKYSFPLMFSTLILTLLNQSDRYILGYINSSREVGYYGLAYNICGLINFFIISPFSLAFSVISWKKLQEKNAKRFFTKTTTYLYFTVIYFAIFISLFTPHFIKFLRNPDYWYAKEIVPWISLSMPFYGLQMIGIFSFYVTQKTNYVILFYGISLMINIFLNIIIIPFFNVYGAAISNLISFLSLCLIIYYYSRNQYFFRYEWSKIICMNMCAIILIIPFFYFEIESRILQILFKIFALLLFPFLLYLFNFYEPIEIQTIKGYTKKFFKLN